MVVTSYLVLFAFLFLGLRFSILIISLRIPLSGLPGKPTIVPLHFYFSKGTLAATWVLFILKALKPSVGYLASPEYLIWFAIFLLYAGVSFITLGIQTLGTSLKIGLPVNKTVLKTDGIFKFSRNPLYLGSFCISMGACLYFPDLIIISFTIYAIIMHHYIILKEEEFLGKQYGNDYQIYKGHTRRYI
jgi:protein-S-isoprenylcysteine O-methyltransferase Ste14